MRVRDGVDCEEIYVYSAEDLADILGDSYVDLRELCRDDDTAAEAVDIVFAALTDDFYGETNA